MDTPQLSGPTESRKPNIEVLLALLQCAESNLKMARANTGFLEHRGRIMAAEEIRNEAQWAYNAELARLLKTAAP